MPDFEFEQNINFNLFIEPPDLDGPFSEPIQPGPGGYELFLRKHGLKRKIIEYDDDTVI